MDLQQHAGLEASFSQPPVHVQHRLFDHVRGGPLDGGVLGDPFPELPDVPVPGLELGHVAAPSHQRLHVPLLPGLLDLLIEEVTDTGEALKGAIHDVLAISALPGIEVEGIFTHFANADRRDKSHAKTQLSRFNKLLRTLEKHSLRVRYRHAANSAAIIEMPASHLDLVRPGIAQYGLWPSDEVDRQRIDLKPVMSIKSRIIHVKDVGADFPVSYGSTHVTPRPTRIATIPVGYADGYDRILSSRGHMLVSGVRAPIIGRVCMDLTMIDVGHVPGVRLEDEVVLLGSQGEETISADEIAERVGTINYEIVSSLTSRVPKVYITEEL